VDTITKADIEAVRAWRRQQHAARVGQSRPHAKGGEAGSNRVLSRLRHLFSWAVVEGYLSETPFRRGTVTVVKLTRSVEGARTRRLQPGEETQLMTHATSHPRAVFVAALTMTCHKTRSVFERYNIVSPGDLRDAARLDEARGHTAAKTAVGEAVGSRQTVEGIGAGDRDRTGDIELGKLAFYR
jgi:hypothetical protein